MTRRELFAMMCAPLLKALPAPACEFGGKHSASECQCDPCGLGENLKLTIREEDIKFRWLGPFQELSIMFSRPGSLHGIQMIYKDGKGVNIPSIYPDLLMREFELYLPLAIDDGARIAVVWYSADGNRHEGSFGMANVLRNDEGAVNLWARSVMSYIRDIAIHRPKCSDAFMYF